MRVIKAVWSGFNSISTRSPTDTGLVLRIPFNLKLPLILQRIESPFSVRTIYQLPVFFVTRPSMQWNLMNKDSKRWEQRQTEILFPIWLCRTASYLRSDKDTYKRELSKTKLALILFCRAKVFSSFNSKIVKVKCRGKRKLHFWLDYAEPPPIFYKYNERRESDNNECICFFWTAFWLSPPAVSRNLTGCYRRNIGGVPVGREGVNSTIEKSYVIFFNPSPQKRLFLRCLPYIAPQHRGEVLILSVTMTELCITFSSDASARE